MKELYHGSETMYTVFFNEEAQKYFVKVTCGTIGWYELQVEW